MKNVRFLAILTVLGLSASQAFAHGEDKAGPHGGFIRMPGAFHTEVVNEGKQNLRVYLLDLNWKNPSVKDSSVDAVIKNENKKVTFNCQKERDSFLCKPEGKASVKFAGQLEINAKREGQVGAIATYSLPLKLEAAPVDNHDSHKGH